MSEEEETDSEAIKQLLKDLDISTTDEEIRDRRNLAPLFEHVLQAPADVLRRVGKDLAIVCGMSGDWRLSLELIKKMGDVGIVDEEIKLWQLRSLVEEKNFAEAIAVLHAVSWQQEQMIHVNYLAGLAFEGLSMRDEAQKRFNSVYSRDPNYRDIRSRARLN